MTRAQRRREERLKKKQEKRQVLGATHEDGFCSRCGTYDNDTFVEDEDGYLRSKCSGCGAYFVCPDCGNKPMLGCANCAATLRKGQYIIYGGQWLCPDCFELKMVEGDKAKIEFGPTFDNPIDGIEYMEHLIQERAILEPDAEWIIDDKTYILDENGKLKEK